MLEDAKLAICSRVNLLLAEKANNTPKDNTFILTHVTH